VFKSTLKEIDDMNAHSRSINSRTVFGISGASDIPSARFDHDRGHDEEEPIKTGGVPADKEVQTEITSSAPMKNSTTAPLKYSISSLPDVNKEGLELPEGFTSVQSMVKFDAIFAYLHC
jgi:hypothetical protein